MFCVVLSIWFVDGSSHLYKRVCPSVLWSVKNREIDVYQQITPREGHIKPEHIFRCILVVVIVVVFGVLFFYRSLVTD